MQLEQVKATTAEIDNATMELNKKTSELAQKQDEILQKILELNNNKVSAIGNIRHRKKE